MKAGDLVKENIPTTTEHERIGIILCEFNAMPSARTSEYKILVYKVLFSDGLVETRSRGLIKALE